MVMMLAAATVVTTLAVVILVMLVTIMAMATMVRMAMMVMMAMIVMRVGRRKGKFKASASCATSTAALIDHLPTLISILPSAKILRNRLQPN